MTYRSLDTLGERVRELRLERHWTQQDLADRLGLSKHRVKMIEEWPGQFYTDTALKLCKALECSPNEFFRWEE